MIDPRSPNRSVLQGVARSIEPLLDEVVFVGGQVAELLITSPGATRVRATTDVDVVVQASTRLKYRVIEDHLRLLGLKNDTREAAPICRWLTPNGLALDVMPVSGEVLGFTNRWYGAALTHAMTYDLGDGLVIQIPEAPVFLGTKWEAFAGRGESDLLASHDLEDIISVLAGRPEIIDEVAAALPELRTYLARRARALLGDEMAVYAIQGALPDAERIPGLISRVVGRIRALTELDQGS